MITNLNSKKGQGSIEYLIVIAIVIIIALILVAVLGDIPGIGVGVTKRASASYWQTTDVAITAFAITASNDNMVLDVRNNLKNSLSSLTLKVNNVAATCNQTGLSAGQGTSCSIVDVTTCVQGDAYSLDVYLTYVDDSTGTTYNFDGEGHKLDGKCAQ